MGYYWHGLDTCSRMNTSPQNLNWKPVKFSQFNPGRSDQRSPFSMYPGFIMTKSQPYFVFLTQVQPMSIVPHLSSSLQSLPKCARVLDKVAQSHQVESQHLLQNVDRSNSEAINWDIFQIEGWVQKIMTNIGPQSFDVEWDLSWGYLMQTTQ